MLGCLLRADGVSLPQWGFKQTEVICQKKPDPDSTSNMWNIEQHFHEKRNFISTFFLILMYSAAWWKKRLQVIIFSRFY